MEKNIHDDRLDDFVQKSFEDFEADPSGDLWDRVERQLPAPSDRKPFGVSLRRVRWQAAAAAAILLLVARLVCVQSYYEEKIQSLTGERQPAPAPASTPAPTVAPVPAPTRAQEENISSHAENNAAAASGSLSAAQPSLPPSANNNKRLPVNDIPKAASSKGEVSVYNQRAKPLNNHPAITEDKTEIPQQQPSQLQPPLQESNSGPVAESAVSKLRAVDCLPVEIAAPSLSLAVRHPGTVETPAITHITQKHQPATPGWYVSLLVSPHMMVERTMQRPVRPNGGLRPLYANRQERPRGSAELGLRVGKGINRWLSLESGLAYQQFTRTAVHRPWFQYREGRPLSSSGAESRSFDYDLNTYGGSASVSLRTEVSGSDTPAETERVAALITTHENIEMLRIPLLAVARVGNSRLQFTVKAGLQGGYLLKNQFNITAYTLQNNKLRLRSNEEYTVTYNRPQRFILGYLLAAGMEYSLGNHLSLTAMPSVCGDLPRTDPQRGKLPGHTAWGMQLGANWWF